jgi:hypothetical protein
MPIPRYNSKDALLTDLRIGHERGLFPVYFERLPRSQEATVCGTVQIALPRKLLMGEAPAIGDKWRRDLLKIAKLPKNQAQLALLDLPETFATDAPQSSAEAALIEVTLFEFLEIDARIRRLRPHTPLADAQRTALSAFRWRARGK